MNGGTGNARGEVKMDGATQAKYNGHRALRVSELPECGICNQCGQSKPREEMLVVHRKDIGGVYMRPRCKDCHNAHERGHRREYKRDYLRRWRKNNSAVEKSYWNNDVSREAAKLRARNFTQEYKDAIAIQRRMNKRGQCITMDDAREMLEKYGRCFPTQYGLTQKGKNRCEQIRSRLRIRRDKQQGSFGFRMPNNFEIRLMVYEESEEEPTLIIAPALQPIPYQKAALRMSEWQRERTQQYER